MGLFGAIGGAIGGLVTGGPAGAIAGALGGLASGGGQQSSQNYSNTSTEQMALRKWTPEEQALVDRMMSNMGLAAEQMSPEAAQAAKQKIYDAMFGTAKDQMTSAYQGAQAQQYALNARRGADTSVSQEQNLLNRARLARELGLASNQATLGAESAYAEDVQNRIALGDFNLRQLNELWNQRKAVSKIVRTSSGSGTYTAPDTTGESIFGMIGSGLTNQNSWLNTKGSNILGGLGGQKALTPYQNWAWTTDPIGD